MNTDIHIGNTLVALDIGIGCSPGLEGIAPADTDLAALTASINQTLAAALATALEQWGVKHVERVMPEKSLVQLHSRSGLIETTRAEWWNKWMKSREDLTAHFAEMREKVNQRIDEHPHNGSLGYWLVEDSDGYRHSRKVFVVASSAREAWDKAERQYEPCLVVPEFVGTAVPDGFAVNAEF